MSEPFIHNRFINETDLDVFGHVNHAKYLVIYEETRWAWIKQKGVDLHTLKSKGEGLVILNVNINYKREITSGETIRIETQIHENNGKIFKIKQVMLKEDGKEASDIIVTAGLFDLKKRILMEPNEFWKTIFDF